MAINNIKIKTHDIFIEKDKDDKGGNLTVGTTTNATSNLTVHGTINTNTLSVTGNTANNGDLTVGTSDNQGTLTVNGTTSTNTLTVTGNTDNKGNLIVGTADATRELTVHGNINTNTVNASGNVTIGTESNPNSELKVLGYANIVGSSGNLTVSENTKTKTLTVTGNTDNKGNLIVGTTDASSNLTVHGSTTTDSLTVNTININVKDSNEIVTLSADTREDTNGNTFKRLNIGGEVKVDGQITVSGPIISDGENIQMGAIQATGNVTVGTSDDPNYELTVYGSTNIIGSNGNSIVGSDGNLTVSGTTDTNILNVNTINVKENGGLIIGNNGTLTIGGNSVIHAGNIGSQSVSYATTAGSAKASDVYGWAKASTKPTYTKSEVDLGNVDNTSDADKPVSNATQQALNSKANASDVYTKTETDGLLNNKANTNDVYSKTETDELLNDKANKSDVYTKTETDNKINEPLYNLGYYDTMVENSDGTYTITRQTGYVDLGTLDWALKEGSGYWFWQTSFVKGQKTASSSSEVVEGKHAIYNATSSNNYGSVNNTFYWSDVNLIIRTSSTTERPSGILQYKLATSYTEKVEKNHYAVYNQRFILDHNKSEAERSANLFDGLLEEGSISPSNGENISESNRYRSKNYVTIKPNKTYTISVNGIANSVNLYFYSNDKTYLGSNYVDFKSTFTSPTNAYYVRFYSTNELLNGTMLNEGDHPYPYQPYNGEIVHDKDIADLYKQEYNLGYYDTMVENSDGTYTITRQTGYLVLDGAKHKFNAKMGNTINAEYSYTGAIPYVYKPTNISINPDIISDDFVTMSADALYATNTRGISLDSSGTILVGFTTSVSTLEDANAYLVQNPISIQYKLATTTTEKVEANHYARYNERFILEHNKNEAEKSANLWDEKWENKVFATNGDFSLNSNCIISKNFIAVKANSNYTLSAPSGQFRIAYYTINKTFISTLTGNQNQTMSITTPNNCSYIKFCSLPDTPPYYGGTYKNDIMLNEGSIALPYQPYEGKVVHEKRLDVKLGSYLKVQDNGLVLLSDGPLKINCDEPNDYFQYRPSQEILNCDLDMLIFDSGITCLNADTMNDESPEFYKYSFPAKNGIFAMTNDLNSYLRLSGGSITGMVDFHSIVDFSDNATQIAFNNSGHYVTNMICGSFSTNVKINAGDITYANITLPGGAKGEGSWIITVTAEGTYSSFVAVGTSDITDNTNRTGFSISIYTIKNIPSGAGPMNFHYVAVKYQ